MTINITIPDVEQNLHPKITVLGVGGSGGNAVNNMINSNLEGVDFLIANTDAQALQISKCSNKIQLGLSTTKGLGAGMRPDVGRQAAEEALNCVWQEKYPNIEGLHQGLPMVDHLDFCWGFKEKQGETISFLAADCLVELLELFDHPYKVRSQDFELSGQKSLSKEERLDAWLSSLAKFEDEKVVVSPELELGAEFKEFCAELGLDAEDLLMDPTREKNDRIMGSASLLTAA